jgi:hypothetical protein
VTFSVHTLIDFFNLIKTLRKIHKSNMKPIIPNSNNIERGRLWELTTLGRYIANPPIPSPIPHVSRRCSIPIDQYSKRAVKNPRSVAASPTLLTREYSPAIRLEKDISTPMRSTIRNCIEKSHLRNLGTSNTKRNIPNIKDPMPLFEAVKNMHTIVSKITRDIKTFLIELALYRRASPTNMLNEDTFAASLGNMSPPNRLPNFLYNGIKSETSLDKDIRLFSREQPIDVANIMMQENKARKGNIFRTFNSFSSLVMKFVNICTTKIQVTHRAN